MEVYFVEFHVNHPILYILVGLLVAVVLGQSVYFLVKALRRSKGLPPPKGYRMLFVIVS